MQKTAIPTFCEVKRPDYFSGFTVYTLCGGEKCLSILNLFFFFVHQSRTVRRGTSKDGVTGVMWTQMQ